MDLLISYNQWLYIYIYMKHLYKANHYIINHLDGGYQYLYTMIIVIIVIKTGVMLQFDLVIYNLKLD
jgi:hypothetical protein